MYKILLIAVVSLIGCIAPKPRAPDPCYDYWDKVAQIYFPAKDMSDDDLLRHRKGLIDKYDTDENSQLFMKKYGISQSEDGTEFFVQQMEKTSNRLREVETELRDRNVLIPTR